MIIDSGKIKIIIDMPTKKLEKILERKLPFHCEIYDSRPVKVLNPLSGESCMLEPDAVAVYDCITGGNLTGNYDIVRKGCSWFREHYPKEYMILLD